MIKYFRFPTTSVHGVQYADRNEVAKDINKFAEENEFKIVQISVCDDTGIFVLFEKE